MVQLNRQYEVLTFKKPNPSKNGRKMHKTKAGLYGGIIRILMITAFGLGAMPAWATRPDYNHASSDVALETRATLASVFRNNPGAVRPGPARLSQALQDFYAARNYYPAWTGYPGAERLAATVRGALRDANLQGLSKTDYAIPAQTARQDAGEDAAAYDLAISQALLRYAFDIRTGRFSPNSVYKDVRLPNTAFDPAKDLGQALNTGSLALFLANLPPPHPEYHRLVKALARYRALADAGGWPSVPSGDEIVLDGSDPRQPALIQRLAFDDPVLAANPNPSADELTEAVKRFQASYGLKADGRVASATLAELNLTAPYRIEQILANMERWRWLPPELERRFIAVNVPAESAEYVRDGRVQLSSRVIVGRKNSPTPMLRTQIDAVIVNPPWNIPGDIAARTILPQLKKNPKYLASHNMVVANVARGAKINWQAVSATGFPYRILQRPPFSALGVLMLNSPNNFDVYLHDTPNKKNFELDDRTISNGCIRVQEIFKFASLALTGDPAAAEDSLKTEIAAHQTKRIPLDQPLPVYMLYWTVIADDDGNAVFFPDRYERDKRLIAAFPQTRLAKR
jgi:L,D-transpeptidase YcbB